MRIDDIRVPEDAPQAVKDLMVACRSENPKDRPMIGGICDILDNVDDGATQVSVHIEGLL